MSEWKDDGGAAFPCGVPGFEGSPGMSLRDWFAGQAVVGLLQSRAVPNATMYAKDAYRVADAMLAEREKGGDA